MGVRDADENKYLVHIGIVTLDAEPPYNNRNLSRNATIKSRFESYMVENDCAVSWSGIDLKKEDGWYGLAEGSLFIRTKSLLDSFHPYFEMRDDLEWIKDELVYMNGYSFYSHSGSFHSGIYHIIFPSYYFPTKIEYLNCGTISMIHTRVLQNRAIITWLHDKQIQLKIKMKFLSPDELAKKLTRENLYKISVESMQKEVKDSELLREIKKNAVKEAFTNIPNVIKILGW